MPGPSTSNSQLPTPVTQTVKVVSQQEYDKRTLELLWRGINAYVRHHRIDVMIGCASLEGTDPAALAGSASTSPAASTPTASSRFPVAGSRGTPSGAAWTR